VVVCLLTTSREQICKKIFRECWQWTSEQTIQFWWRSRSRIGIRIATLVRRVLAEVCPVPVLLVHYTAIILGLRPLSTTATRSIASTHRLNKDSDKHSHIQMAQTSCKFSDYNLGYISCSQATRLVNSMIAQNIH